MNGDLLLEHGIVAKGTPFEAHIEGFLGWDPVRKRVYFVEFEGPAIVYYGKMEARGGALEAEFDSIVGAPGSYRARDEFPGPNQWVSTIWRRTSAGRWRVQHKAAFVRK